MMPDHSVLLLTVSTTCFNKVKHDKEYKTVDNSIMNSLNTAVYDHTDAVKDRFNVKNNSHIYFQRYKVKPTHPQFMKNNVFSEALLDMIARIEQTCHTQDEIDDMYDALCSMYHKEMNLWLKKKKCSP